jgi:diadenosine tetraphosphatase ApaH/serine/threonine PP2A family protein phosphatase
MQIAALLPRMTASHFRSGPARMLNGVLGGSPVRSGTSSPPSPKRSGCDIDGLGRVLFCHGSPRSDDEIISERTPLGRLRVMTQCVDADVVVCGHTHMPFDRCVDEIRVVNPGSVGMPYEAPGAYWALLGPDVEFRRTEYDREGRQHGSERSPEPRPTRSCSRTCSPSRQPTKPSRSLRRTAAPNRGALDRSYINARDVRTRARASIRSAGSLSSAPGP